MSDKKEKPSKNLSARETKEAAARDTIDSISMLSQSNWVLVLYEISSLLNTGLDKHTLSLCVSLCENGVNPEALAVWSSIVVY
jgi:mitotic-spindle organizing protein 1